MPDARRRRARPGSRRSSWGPGTKTPRWFRKIDPGSVSVCATDGQLQQDGEVDENELHQQRRVADELDVGRREAPQQPVRREPGHADHDARGSVARMIPTKLTKSVLSRPTRNALPYVSVELYGIGLSLMSKPALRFRKPKPKPRPRSSMAVRRLRTMNATSSADDQDDDRPGRRCAARGRRAMAGRSDDAVVPGPASSVPVRREAPGRDAPRPGASGPTQRYGGA